MNLHSTPATELKVLSAGAVKAGVHALELQVKRELGHNMKLVFTTAPQIAKRLAAGEAYDILISPPFVIEQAVADGSAVAESRVSVGRVGVGVVVRCTAPAPDVATVAALKQALLAADSVVYNSASTGIYLERLFINMNIQEQLRPKSTRYAEGAAVMEHIISGKGNEIGFGAITEINRYSGQGLTFVGPLPARAQNYTSYDAVLMSGASSADAAKAVLRLLETPATRAAISAAGVE